MSIDTPILQWLYICCKLFWLCWKDFITKICFFVIMSVDSSEESNGSKIHHAILWENFRFSNNLQQVWRKIKRFHRIHEYVYWYVRSPQDFLFPADYRVSETHKHIQNRYLFFCIYYVAFCLWRILGFPETRIYIYIERERE